MKKMKTLQEAHETTTQMAIEINDSNVANSGDG
jgi:hypothetical protein